MDAETRTVQAVEVTHDLMVNKMNLEIEFKTGAKVHGCVNQLWFDDGKLCFAIEESETNAIGRTATIPIENLLRFTFSTHPTHPTR